MLLPAVGLGMSSRNRRAAWSKTDGYSRLLLPTYYLRPNLEGACRSDPIWKVHVERATPFSPSTLGFPGRVVAVLNFECFKQIVVLALPLQA